MYIEQYSMINDDFRNSKFIELKNEFIEIYSPVLRYHDTLQLNKGVNKCWYMFLVLPEMLHCCPDSLTGV